MFLYIDHREHALLPLLLSENDPWQTVAQNLELGDAQVVLGVGDGAAPALIFERKTVADLGASIKDGRYREQAGRLGASSGLPPWRITYIIEGARGIHDLAGPLASAVLGLQYRHGFQVHFTRGLSETAGLLQAICARLAKDPTRWDGMAATAGAGGAGEEGAGAGTSGSYIETLRVKARRIENITPEVCFRLQLCQVPGVSTKLAEALAQRYRNMAEMVLELSTAGREEACRSLRELPLLGPKKAAVLYDYLCGGEGAI